MSERGDRKREKSGIEEKEAKGESEETGTGK